jgi:hypothetical protein
MFRPDNYLKVMVTSRFRTVGFVTALAPNTHEEIQDVRSRELELGIFLQ